MKEDDLLPDKDPRSSNSDRNENLERSPALGEQGQADHGTGKSHNSSERGREINEDMIKKAIKKRVPYFRSNLEYVPLYNVISFAKMTGHVGLDGY